MLQLLHNQLAKNSLKRAAKGSKLSRHLIKNKREGKEGERGA